MTGHGYFGNIDPAFSWEFSVQPNFKWLNSMANLFPEYTGIPILVPIKYGKFSQLIFQCLKFTENFIPVPTHTITMPYDLVFSHKLSCDHITSKTT